MKELSLLLAGAAALLVFGNKSASAQTPLSRGSSNASGRLIGGTGWITPRASVGYSTNVGGVSSSGASSVGAALAGFAKNGGFNSLFGDFFSAQQSAGAGADIFSSITLPSSYAGAGDIFASGLAEDAAMSAGVDYSLAGAAPYLAAAAAIDSEVFNGEVGQHLVGDINGLGDSVADVFGW